MALETDLERIAQLAADRRDEFEVLHYLLENDERSDADLDAWLEGLAAPVIATIDCTLCANCCRSLDVYLTPDDVTRLAAGLGRPAEAIIAEHVNQAAAARVGEWGKLRHKPCAFLHGKLCSVYAHRPETCRTYPAFTPDFRWVLPDIIEGAGGCPIIYNVLAALCTHFGLDVVRSYAGRSDGV